MPARTAFLGNRPLLRRASVIIHCNCPLVLRNSSAAHFSTASIVAASTRRIKLLVVISFLGIGNDVLQPAGADKPNQIIGHISGHRQRLLILERGGHAGPLLQQVVQLGV